MIKNEFNFQLFFSMFLLISLCNCQPDEKESVTAHLELSEQDLKDKIKGGWAGQVIGVTYGGPTEFRYNGTLMQDYHPIVWNDSVCEWWFDNTPGLYDDVYMDLTFMEIIEKSGLDATSEEFALAFAHADYPLWHANQAARNNILNGLMPPASGHWKNNPHSDDIDFQIEADFAGLMSPGLPNISSQICDKVGHIMNYGDGWYGGVYVAAMYANAFLYDDVKTVVKESLKSIPSESNFYKCIDDVIIWCEQHPDDWKQTWFEVQKKWSEDVGCPDGVFSSFNIDAKINAAYVVIGLLYGQMTFGKTMDIATRCGLDSDCNPATAAGILGAMIGYDSIPEKWKKPLHKVESRKFAYSNWSLVEVYDIGYRQAIMNLQQNGISMKNGKLQLRSEEVRPVKLEEGWKGLMPVSKKDENTKLTRKDPVHNFSFEGSGFVLKGFAQNLDVENKPHYEMKLLMTVNDQNLDTIKMTTNPLLRRLDIGWKYDLDNAVQQVKLQWLNPVEHAVLLVGDLIVYQPKAEEYAHH